MVARIKKNDTVIILAGKDKGRSGRVLAVMPKEDRVVVEGLNLMKRHTAPNITHPNGGVISKEASLHISNVALRDPKTGKPTRVGFKTNDKGVKVRVAKGSGVEIDVGPPPTRARRPSFQRKRKRRLRPALPSRVRRSRLTTRRA
jgi:large subunit ribosomal protein L24